jgi:hypothetical protein
MDCLLKTLFTPKFLLKDDYSIDENRLAIVDKSGSNFALFLLNSSNMGFPIFQEFLSREKFSSNPDSDEKIKQKLLESMIFSIPSTRKDPNYSNSKILLNTHQHECFENALTMIPEQNKENFSINILQNFAISQSRNIENSKYIDFIIPAIKKNISKDNWADAIEKIFSTPSKDDNAIKNAQSATNNYYIKKIKKLIDETFEQKPQDKQEFIKKLSDNSGVDLKSKFAEFPQEKTYRHEKKKWSWSNSYLQSKNNGGRY